MQKNVLFQAAGYRKKQKRKKIWLRIVAFMSAVVVFCTTYALILPALTKERPTFCGMEEHTHTDECYETVTDTVMNCSFELHEHISGECYDEEGNIYCRTAEYSIHKHNEYCYGSNGAMICTLDDSAELHTHTDDCYSLLSVDGEETEPEQEKVLVCTHYELELHEHSDECFDEEGKYICDKVEVFAHNHGSECVTITTETRLICTLPEHTHNDECYIDRTADIEDASVWERTIPTELSGIWSKDILLVAKSQLGYRESTVNLEDSDNEIKNGYTRYGEWYGDPYAEWSTLFVAFCLEYAGVDSEYLPYDADLTVWAEKLNELALTRDTALYMPNIGDLVFLSNDRIAVVAEYIIDDEENITALKVIEGDSDNCVQYCEYAISDSAIQGYADVTVAYENYCDAQPIIKSYSDDTINVTATYKPTAQIPDDAELSVTKILDEEKYNKRYDEALEAIDLASGQVKDSNITDFWLYDICFISNGEEIQPGDSVDIQINLNETVSDKTEDISVVHFAKEGTELPELSAEKTADEISLGFSVDSFSEFAIVGSTNTVIDILSMTKYTTKDLSDTQPFAIVQGNYALLLTVEDGNPLLSASEVWTHEVNSNLSVDSRAQQWIIANSRISTTVDTTTYYLIYSNNSYSVTDNQAAATTFSTYWTNGVFRAYTNRIYLSVTSDTFASSSSTDLSLYTASTSGSYKVVFDAQIGNAQYMSSSNHKYQGAECRTVTVTNGKVVLPHNDPNSSDTANYISIAYGDSNPENDWYKLNGWYDVVNEIFYDSSMLGKEISINSNTIFYPEYISATYDVGQDNGKVIKNQPDTSDFINTYMFDYNEIFNVDKSDCTSYDGNTTTVWKTDMDGETPLIFTDWINPSGNLGYMQGLGDATPNGVTVNKEHTLGTRGEHVRFPGTITAGIVGDLGVSNQNNPQLDALFTKETIPGRVYLGEGDWLYNYDHNIGYYYYNSADNAVAYNQSKQRFYVYDYTLAIDNNNSLHDFTPYTYRDAPIGGEADAAEKDTELNYWVGMQSEINFYLPEDSGNEKNISTHGDALQLRFSGDDDVWIFLDGQLVLDLGGMHDVVYGEINFAKGTVRTGQAFGSASSQIANNKANAFTEMPGLTGEPGTTLSGVTEYALPQVKGGQYHTITIYYLERGSALSNCAIYFNISPFYELAIEKHGTHGEFLEGAEFTIYEDEACTQVAELYVRNELNELVAVPAVFVTDADGIARCEGLFLGKTYYMKETEPPPGYPRMDMYTIEINLSLPGEAFTLALNSDGEKWTFADSYVFSTDHDHKVEIAVYNDKFIGGDKQIYVEKAWGEGSTNIPESVTVRLYANGEPTSRTIVLSEENDWKGNIMSLPELDENGNEIIYTVVEESVPYRYGVSYSETIGEGEGTVVVPGHWEDVDSFTDGRIFRITASNGKVLTCNSNNSVTPETSNIDDASQQWKAIASGNGFALQNMKYITRYLYIASGSVTTADTYNTANTQIFTASGLKLYVTLPPRYNWQSSTNYYVVQNTSSYGTTTRSSSGTNFSLSRWIAPYETTGSVEVPGWLVTNTPWPELTSIPIAKTWDPTVGTPPVEQKFALYLVTEGQEDAPVWVKDITINGENSWMGSFDNLAYPENGSYYVVIEVTEDYMPNYKGPTASIFVNDKYVEGSRIEFDQNGTAGTVEIENTRLLMLPNTGGSGIIWYTIGGVLLIVSAVILLLYKKRRCRLEDYFSP